MARNKREKAGENFTDLDSYEKWLEKQQPPRVRARSGFISFEEKEAEA